MKSIVISSVVVALLALTGCSSKDPVTSDADKAAQEATQQQVEKETVVVDSVNAEVVDSQSSALSTISSVEKDFATIYFEFDKFNINTENQPKVTTNATLANATAKSFTIKLEGNCDEWGSDEYNFALGLKRANSVKKSLVSEGVDSNRITMVSYGESNPTCSDKTRECWKKNRRVDFKLLP